MIETIIGKEFPKKVIPLVDQAKTSIDIVVFDWRWYPQDPGNPVQLFNQAIVRAVRRGVKVRALINYSDLEKSLKSVGVEVKKFRTQAILHAKLIIIDGQICVIGSHNYTANAFQTNYEASVILEGLENIERLIQFFNNLWQL